MNIFVTGGTGFIGFNLVRHLLKNGHRVGITGLYSVENAVAGVERFPLGLRDLGGDVAARYHDVLFHQAADNDTQKTDSEAVYEANVAAPKALFERFADAGCKQFVYASSAAVYGNSPAPFDEKATPLSPMTAYARSKADFEDFAAGFGRDRKVNVIGLRYSNVYGPGESHKGNRASMVRQIIATVAAGMKPQVFWDGTQRRDWVYVKDVVSANVAAMRYQGDPVVVNVGSGQSWTFLDVVETVGQETHHRIKVSFVPNPIIDTYQNHTECDIGLARSLLGYQPEFTLETGVKSYYKSWT